MTMRLPSNSDPAPTDDKRAAAAHHAFWRGLDELEASQPGITAGIHDPVNWHRRELMKLMAASLALAGTPGCSRPPLEQIAPYREGPVQSIYGKPVFYATAIARDGYGAGVLVETNMGRPTKIEGNPLHPASLGATDIFSQAAVLELWDPDRSQVVLHGRNVETWDRFTEGLRARLADAQGGAGLRILTETVSSPTLHSQLRKLAVKYPRARWHQYQPLNRDNVHAGSALAFGEPLEPRYAFARARVAVAFDADFLGSLPGCVRYARDFAEARRATTIRLYAAEGTPSLTGAMADDKRVIRSAEILRLAHALAHALGVAAAQAVSGSTEADAWLDAVASDLAQHRGASVVIAGDRQPAAVHALVHAINQHLGNAGTTVEYATPVAFEPASETESMRELVAAMAAGQVQMLIILGGNPVYNAPADLDFGTALQRVTWKAHLSLYHDETSVRCDWHLPAAHVLEAWSDIRAFDSTVTIQQPCIAPLYGGHSAHELLAEIVGPGSTSSYDIVREHWKERRGSSGFDLFWNDTLRRGTVEEPPAMRRAPAPQRALSIGVGPLPDENTLELVFAADPTLGDGRHANNAWLQELPKPLSTLTWDNAAMISPALAQRLKLKTEDVIELGIEQRRISAPVWISPGHADHSVTVYLGHGRTRAGSVGTGVGFDAYALRSSAAPWIASGATLTPTGTRYPLAATQTHDRMEGRDIVRMLTRDQAIACAKAPCPPPPVAPPAATLYPAYAYDGYKWGMSIDLGSCIGCAACTIACQAENNISVVGKSEVRRGREMHWIRVDRYYTGSAERPRTLFQPVPCMQCEHAPCEVVCPVEASVHDAEGLNVQVYNRCVGTRYCSNNCPYKVRRFNFLSYVRDMPSLNAQRNPEVTVRMRGVMEKCTYCTQRITRARIDADKSGRRIADGEVVTACQAVCPTQAIVFGDLNDSTSAVNRRKASPLDYALLAELNTRPRTTYLPKVIDPAPGRELA